MSDDNSDRSRRPTRDRVVPLTVSVVVAAVVAAVVLGLAWTLAGTGSGDSGDTAGPVPGRSGDGASAPSASPGGSSDPSAGGPSGDGRAEPVPISSYHPYDARHLAINYAIGVPQCYGTIREPAVVERDDAVVVTLSRVPPRNQNLACIEIANRKSVTVTLSEPLGDRRVVDGSGAGGALEVAAPFEERG